MVNEKQMGSLESKNTPLDQLTGLKAKTDNHKHRLTRM